MNALIIAAIGLNMVAASPALSGPALDRALANYRALLAGQMQLGNLTPQARLDLLELERWLHNHEGIAPSETREQCLERLASESPSDLELALVDLKCSQRPSGHSDR